MNKRDRERLTRALLRQGEELAPEGGFRVFRRRNGGRYLLDRSGNLRIAPGATHAFLVPRATVQRMIESETKR